MEESEKIEENLKIVIQEKVFSQAEQDALTPQLVLQIGNIGALTNGIRPAVKMADDYTGVKSSENDPYVHYVSKKNVLHTVDHIRRNSPILKEMEDKGEIQILGAMYQMETGRVEFFN